MITVGIICEYNPFHIGHAHQIEEIRRLFDEPIGIVCLMSGNFVQRGEPAIADKTVRARTALRAGADLVLELPFPYAASGSDSFARAGVFVLSSLGIDYLAFGSETADKAFLVEAAAVLASDSFASLWKRERDAHPEIGSVVLLSSLFERISGKKFPSGANDSLGISYLKQILLQKSSLRPLVIKREPTMPSAHAIRNGIRSQGGLEAIAPLLPPETLREWENGEKKGLCPIELEAWNRLLFTFFRTADPAYLEHIAECTGGLENRLVALAQAADTPEAFLSSLPTKKYTDASLRRALLFCAVGVKKSDLDTPPAYCLLLAASEVGCAFLSALRRKALFPILSKPADLPQTPDAARQAQIGLRADALLTLCLPKPRETVFYRRQSPTIQGKK